MRKIISLFVVFILSFSIGGCHNDELHTASVPAVHESAPAASTETISEQRLIYSDKTEKPMHVGKRTVIFGKVISVNSDRCIIQLMRTREKLPVLMDSTTLTKVKTGEFVAITGIVSAYTPQHYFLYEIDFEKFENFEVMDSIFQECINSIELNDNGYVFLYCDDELFLEYLTLRGSSFIIRDDQELSNYLVGKWYFNFSMHSVEFKANGEFVDDTHVWFHAPDNKWSVSNGKVDSLFAEDPVYLYRLSDEVFVCGGMLAGRVPE